MTSSTKTNEEREEDKRLWMAWAAPVAMILGSWGIATVAPQRAPSESTTVASANEEFQESLVGDAATDMAKTSDVSTIVKDDQTTGTSDIANAISDDTNSQQDASIDANAEPPSLDDPLDSSTADSNETNDSDLAIAEDVVSPSPSETESTDAEVQKEIKFGDDPQTSFVPPAPKSVDGNDLASTSVDADLIAADSATQTAASSAELAPDVESFDAGPIAGDPAEATGPTATESVVANLAADDPAESSAPATTDLVSTDPAEATASAVATVDDVTNGDAIATDSAVIDPVEASPPVVVEAEAQAPTGTAVVPAEVTATASMADPLQAETSSTEVPQLAPTDSAVPSVVSSSNASTSAMSATVASQAASRIARPFLGVGIRNPSNSVVTTLYKGSSAEQLGVVVGDEILKFNGAEIRDVNSLRTALQGVEVGTNATLEISRAGALKTLGPLPLKAK